MIARFRLFGGRPLLLPRADNIFHMRVLWRRQMSSSSQLRGRNQSSGKQEPKEQVTLIGLDGKLIGSEMTWQQCLEEQKLQANQGKTELILRLVDSNRKVYKLVNQSSEKPPVITPPSSTTTTTTQKVKSEKEFKISDTITKHDMGVKIKGIKDNLTRGHSVKLIVTRKPSKRHTQFNLFKPGKDDARRIIEEVLAEVDECGRVAVAVKEISPGILTALLVPKKI